MALDVTSSDADMKKIDTDFEMLLKEKRFRSAASTSALALSTMFLANCGGGSSSSSQSGGNTSTNQGSTNTNQGTQSVTTQPPALPPSGNLLSLTKVGSDYASSAVQGFTLESGAAKYTVSDDAGDNSYKIKLSANGSGALEFSFDDANDTVTLMEGSSVSGFDQLNVTNGTLNATNADLGSINTIIVASGIKISYSQVAKIQNLVSNSDDGNIEIFVANAAEAADLQARISSGSLKVYGATDAVQIAADQVEAAQPTVVEEVKTVVATALAAAPTPPPAVVAPRPVQTLLAEKSAGTVSIVNNDALINASEASGTIKFIISPTDGFDVKSAKIGSTALSATGVAGEYTINGAALSDGEYELKVELADELTAEAGDDIFGGLVTLNANITVDKTAPSAAAIQVEGETNGLNSTEASSKVQITIGAEGGSDIVSVTVGSQKITPQDGAYYFDATSLADGAHDVTVTTEDGAGNSSTTVKSVTIDRAGPTEATITVDGDDGSGLSAAEASGSVNVNVDLNGAASIVSVTGPAGSLSADDAGVYSMDASTLSEGSHEITVVTADVSGNETSARHVFSIDRTAPDEAAISISGSSFGLTPAELVDAVPVFVDAGSGADVVSVKLGSSELSVNSAGYYSFSGGSLAAGVHEIKVVTSDAAGNTKSSSADFTVLGYTSAVADIFDIRSTTSGDTVNFSVYVKNILNSHPDGIKSYDFDIQLDAAELDYVEGSFAGFEGSMFAVGEARASEGLVRVAGVSRTAFESYDLPFMTFSAREVGGGETTAMILESMVLDSTSYGDVEYYLTI